MTPPRRRGRPTIAQIIAGAERAGVGAYVRAVAGELEGRRDEEAWSAFGTILAQACVLATLAGIASMRERLRLPDVPRRTRHAFSREAFAVPWDESKHPRGQPENAGQFRSGGGGSSSGPEGPSPEQIEALKERKAAIDAKQGRVAKAKEKVKAQIESIAEDVDVNETIGEEDWLWWALDPHTFHEALEGETPTTGFEGADITPEEAARVVRVAKLMQAKASTRSTGHRRLWRGVHFASEAEALRAFPHRSIITAPVLTATTFQKDVAVGYAEMSPEHDDRTPFPVLLEYGTPNKRGLPGVQAEPYGPESSSEVVMPKGVQFRVESKHVDPETGYLVVRLYETKEGAAKFARLDVAFSPGPPTGPAGAATGSTLFTAPFTQAIASFESKVPQLATVVKTLTERALQLRTAIVEAEKASVISILAERSKAIEAAISNSFWAADVSIETTKNLKSLLAQSLRGFAGAKPESGLERGLSVGEFIAEARVQGAANLTVNRLRTIYRNATNGAYNDGRAEVLRAPEAKAAAPLVMIREIRDKRTRGNPAGLYPDQGKHWQMNGYVGTVEDLQRRGLIPPCGHNCRGGIRPVSSYEAKQLDLLDAEGNPDPAKIRKYNGDREAIVERGEYPDPGWR